VRRARRVAGSHVLARLNVAAAVNLVKLCPTCAAENAPTAARCACGAFLIGVDLAEKTLAAVAKGKADNPLPTVAEASAATRMAGGTGYSPLPPGEGSGVREGSKAPVCSFDDCGQINPPGSTICVYCNRPLVPEAEHPAIETSKAAAPARRTLIQLPAALETRFDIEQPLQAAGGEADLFIVRDKRTGQRAVLKLYRHGIEPNTEVLERVSRAAPDQLVHLLEHGRDQGVPYELLEYCEHGSLRTLLKGRPVPMTAARTLLTELTDAIGHLHDCGIVHRDLKPENVLIRGLLPLDLVLTDFGIASVTQATMHYTSGARTLRYSAPEAGSNWVGKPTDYWALGMMLVEALNGRHPFEGLSDQVIAHWLVTRPIDVSGVADARWQRLCRGLLTRDPKTRWGADEIARWLGGDDSLAIVDEHAAPVAGAASPYRVGERECRTPRELAVALAADWTAGVKDLKRGMLRAWLQNDLRDQNLARVAADAEEALEISDDERLLRLLLRLDPHLPPVFKGYDISVAGLAALTRKALDDHNEERQAVIELLDRRLLDCFPGSALQDVHARFDQAKLEFERALDTAFAAGAPRDLAPEGRDWQLRMLLFVLEPPKGLVENLRASARRVGGRAAQRCDWYRALGDPAAASPATLGAMVVLGPPAAQQGMEAEREVARRALGELSMTIDSAARLHESHGDARERLAATLEASQDEDEVLALAARLGELSQAIERSLDALWREAVFESRPVTEPARLVTVRRRIGEWAAWKAGEAWGGFGEQVELREVTERRGYRLQLATQIEARRVPYKYGPADIARMPARAKATLDAVWSCAMPALPQFAADLKITRAQELRCPRCGASGRVELQESWGSTAYPFSTTFACADKVGVQCQTRLAWANEHLPASGVPAFVSDFVEAHARQEDAPERTLEFMAPRIPARWLALLPSEKVRGALSATLDGAASDVKANERVSAQRLRITWNELDEVHYRYRGKDYVVWIPERRDALPIAIEHPLPSTSDAATSQSADAVNHTTPAIGASSPAIPGPAARSLPRWLRTLMWWGGALIVAACLLTWIVNWKP
jgi:serine/threonine protein kinase/HAMP domain-containing protein